MEKMKQSCARQRESWIDVLKGIGIVLVVIGHTSQNNCLVDWIYTFHMPMFFSLSGYLWNRLACEPVTFKEFAIKRIKKILWPFVLFRILLIMYWIVLESHFRPLDLGPIWFLIVLFVVELVAFLILNNRQDEVWINIMVLVMAIGLLVLWKVILPDSEVMAWGLRSVNAFIWYVSGQFVGSISKKIKKMFGKIIRCIVLWILFTVSVIVCVFNGNVSMWSNDFGNTALYIIGNIVGTLFVALLCKWFWRKNDVIEFFGQNTIIILATHEPIKRVILKVAEIISGKFNFDVIIEEIQKNILTSLTVAFIVLMIDVLVILVFRKIKKLVPSFVRENLLSFVR